MKNKKTTPQEINQVFAKWFKDQHIEVRKMLRRTSVKAQQVTEPQLFV